MATTEKVPNVHSLHSVYVVHREQWTHIVHPYCYAHTVYMTTTHTLCTNHHHYHTTTSLALHALDSTVVAAGQLDIIHQWCHQEKSQTTLRSTGNPKPPAVIHHNTNLLATAVNPCCILLSKILNVITAPETHENIYDKRSKLRTQRIWKSLKNKKLSSH